VSREGKEYRLSLPKVRRRYAASCLPITSNPKWISALAIDSTGKHLITAGEEGSVHTWDVKTGVQVLSLKAPGDPVVRLEFSRDGTRLYGWTSENSLYTWPASPAP